MLCCSFVPRVDHHDNVEDLDVFSLPQPSFYVVDVMLLLCVFGAFSGVRAFVFSSAFCCWRLCLRRDPGALLVEFVVQTAFTGCAAVLRSSGSFDLAHLCCFLVSLAPC